jgi:hypothetical protein
MVRLGMETVKPIAREDETVLQKGDMIVVCGPEPDENLHRNICLRARQIGKYSGFGVFYTGSLEMTDEVVRAILEQFPRPERMILSTDRTIINRVKIPEDKHVP